MQNIRRLLSLLLILQIFLGLQAYAYDPSWEAPTATNDTDADTACNGAWADSAGPGGIRTALIEAVFVEVSPDQLKGQRFLIS